MSITITDLIARDIRFPTSRTLDGSDATHPDPDYSAAYVTLKTNSDLEGDGLTFTIGRGNDLCMNAIESLRHFVVGRTLDSITSDFGQWWSDVVNDSQLRWLGPEKGIIHLATGALTNAVWDLYAKSEQKPLWLLLAEMSPEEWVRAIDFRYITDALTKDEALEILQSLEPSRQDRIKTLRKDGYPVYTTSAGWLGYSDEKVQRLCHEAINEGYTHIKMKVGSDLNDDCHRAKLIRDIIGYDRTLMMDANQKWDVSEAIKWMERLSEFKPLWIEEPTSPDDVLGHAAIARAVTPIKVATGEHCCNRVIFKQLLQAEAIGYCQIDACRLAGVNEVMAVLLLAAKFNIPVCPHAGGVGLCEYVQHLSMADYICVSGTMDGRVMEYVDHLHEHFETPIQIKNARCLVPDESGYSITMKEDSLTEFEFPHGAAWSE